MWSVLLLFALFPLFAPAVRAQMPNYMMPNYGMMNARYNPAEMRYPGHHGAPYASQIPPYNPYNAPHPYGRNRHVGETANSNTNTNVNTNPGSFK